MKQMIFSLAYILGISLPFVACSDDDLPGGADRELNGTTSFVTVPDPGSYSIFYKPEVGYVGDPMPFFDPVRGEIRVLYLQDWRDGGFTYHPIYGVSTTDAASYSNLGEVVPCGTLAEQDPALGTGSTIYKDGTYYTFYTGHKDNATSSQPKEVILLSVSSDFRTWTKDRSFRFEAPEGYDRNEFRDPYVFYDEGRGLYRMLLSAYKSGRPVIAQFVSSDLRSWTAEEPFFHVVFDDRFYECPDVFKMGDYWYMVYSDQQFHRVQYFYARTLDDFRNLTKFDFPPHEGILEGTAFYAGKTAAVGNERFMFGWCCSRSGNENAGTADWGGNLVAHKLVQNADGTLGLAPANAVVQKFTQPKSLNEHARKGNVSGDVASGYALTAGSSVRFARLEPNNKITMTVKVPSGNEAVFGFSFVDCDNKAEKYNVYVEARYDMLKFAKVVTNEETGQEERTDVNECPFIASADGEYQVTIVNEQSVCVVYINGKYAFSNRIYNMPYNSWGIFCSDGSAEFRNIVLSSDK